MNKNPQEKTLKRLVELGKLVAKTKLGETIPLVQVQEALLPSFGGKEPARWDRVITSLVEYHNAKPIGERQCSLAVNSKGILLQEGEPSRYEQRKEKAKEQKDEIGRCLLGWLFDAPSEALSWEDWKKQISSAGKNFSAGEYPTEFSVNWRGGDTIHNRLKRKRNILRARTVVSLISDAGTSCEAFIGQLVEANELPLRTNIGEMDMRRISPSVTTNSLPIAGLLAKKDAIGLTLIGGRLNRERLSIVGEMGLSWARWARARGTVDLSVIGTTGITMSREGGYVAYMTDDLECEIKGEFLQLAGFRCIICDASKLVMGSYVNRFSSINKSDVDLVVIDDGFNLSNGINKPFEGSYKKVKEVLDEFSRTSADCGVGIITVSTQSKS